ncbi:helix-turn-helix domain-containing protein [Actinomadura sp. 6N118]|uniref:helix-turn-helix domain-containing protein n=1 Tax=Actinomadura sp. 6N118 TaxID=3375151 RepID=UPI0037A1A1DC
MTPRRSDEKTPLKLFGSQLKRFRELTGLSQDQLGLKGHVTGSFIGAIERGESRCQRELAVLLDDVLDTRGTLPSLWDDLVMNAAFPVWFDWPKIEGAAIHLQTYQALLVDGLLQTPAYAGALLGGDQDLVEARLSRQEVLTREDPPPPVVTVLLNEAALHYPIGDKHTMREQLERLSAAVTPRLAIQIVPYGANPPVNRGGSFALATLEDLSEVAHLDTAVRGMSFGSRQDIRAVRESFESLRAHALPVGMSIDLIHRTAEELWT